MSLNRLKLTSHGLLIMAASAALASAQTPFMISNVSSKLVLDVPGFSKASGKLIQQFTPNAGTNQQWMFHRHGAKIAYEIVNVNSGMVLDVPASSTTPGQQIQQFPANGGNNQLWQFSYPAGATGYEIVSLNQYDPPGPQCSSICLAPQPVNLVLDVPDFSKKAGELIQQFTENGGTNQQWLFEPQVVKSISVLGANGTIEITGWGFQAGTEVCPVIENAPGGGFVSPCANVASDGAFTYTWQPPANSVLYFSDNPGGSYLALSGNPMVVVEDKNAYVLAIANAPGAFYEGAPK